jgi:uncharacterized membrane protein YdjX (TVP38/TMEM64 family)
MNSETTKRYAKLMTTTTAVVVSLAFLLWLNQDAVWAFVDCVRDRQTVVAYLDQLGFIGPLVLMALVGPQTVVSVLPGEPLMIAGAYAYGFAGGFLMNWLVAVAASQAVYLLARHAGHPLVERFVPAQVLDKWTRAAGEKGMIFFLLSFLIPMVPSDTMNLVAGLSAIGGRRFFVASLLGRIPMTILLTLVGANGFTITPATMAGLTAFGVLMLAAWWYLNRERPGAVASGSRLPKAGRAARRSRLVPIAPRLWLNQIPSLALEMKGRIWPALRAKAGSLLAALGSSTGIEFRRVLTLSGWIVPRHRIPVLVRQWPSLRFGSDLAASRTLT